MASSGKDGSATATIPRQIIGPLTTAFEMPPHCSTATYTGETVISDSAYILVSAYTEPQCENSSVRPCFPHVAAYTDIEGIGYFYSPGTQCPSDWVTATTVTSGQGAPSSIVDGVRIDTLMDGETVAVCCPSSFKYTTTEYDDNVDPVRMIGKCVRTATGSNIDDYWYHACGSQGLIPMTNANFGKPTGVSVLVTTGPSSFWKTTTLPYGGMEINAPTLQLNYRADDVGATPTSGVSSSGTAESNADGANSSGSGSSASISGGAIAGIVIGIVVALAGLGLLVFFIRRRRRASRVQQSEKEITDAHKDGIMVGGSSSASRPSPVSAYEKPELAGAEAPRDISTYTELDARPTHPAELEADTSHAARPVHYAEVDGQNVTHGRH